jgi:hypothetical protein
MGPVPFVPSTMECSAPSPPWRSGAPMIAGRPSRSLSRARGSNLLLPPSRTSAPRRVACRAGAPHVRPADSHPWLRRATQRIRAGHYAVHAAPDRKALERRRPRPVEPSATRPHARCSRNTVTTSTTLISSARMARSRGSYCTPAKTWASSASAGSSPAGATA